MSKLKNVRDYIYKWFLEDCIGCGDDYCYFCTNRCQPAELLEIILGKEKANKLFKREYLKYVKEQYKEGIDNGPFKVYNE